MRSAILKMSVLFPVVMSVVMSCALTRLASAHETGDPAAGIRTMVEKSLPYIQEAGASWRKGKQCHSCHRTTFTAWALNRAAEQKYTVDPDLLEDWNEYAADWTSLLRAKDRQDAKMTVTLERENDAVAQLLLGRAAGTEQAAWVEPFRDHLVAAQLDSGAWKHGGQLPRQKRPERETQEVSTMWAAVALSEYRQQDAVGEAIERGKAWVGNNTVPQSTEWWAVRLMLERATGSAEHADALRIELLDKQNKDGGWGWLCVDSSDAFGTGLALYALARDGLTLRDPKMQQAIEFLQETQSKNGSWAVNGTKTNSRNRTAETATYWGTCWAVIAMLEFNLPR